MSEKRGQFGLAGATVAFVIAILAVAVYINRRVDSSALRILDDDVDLDNNPLSIPD